MNNLDPVEPGDEQRSYRIKSWPRKMLVVSAGSAMHFIMAIVLLAVLALFYGVQNDDGAWQVSARLRRAPPPNSASSRAT